MNIKINWKARVKNPVFWAEVAAAVVFPILAHMGLNWEAMTTWATLWQTLLAAISNPVIVVAVVISVWNAINDPTTAGIGDSARALEYSKPYAESDAIVDDKIGGSE